MEGVPHTTGAYGDVHFLVVTEHGLLVLVVDGDDFLESLAPEIVQRVAIDAVEDVTRL
jgi:hypothetical protein